MAPSIMDVLRLFRIHTGAATAAVPALAAYMCGAGEASILLVLIAGLSHHAWGFSLNEVLDLPVDRRAAHLAGKPLVSGKVGVRAAWALSSLSLAVSFASMLGASLASGGDVLITALLLAGSTACGSAYDLWSKKAPFMDIFVGAWFALLILSAASTAGIPGTTAATVVLVAAASGAHLVFNNMIEGGIKDAGTDRRSGVRSAAVALGVRADGGAILLPRAFRALAFALRGSFVAVLMVISYLSWTRGAHEALIVVIAVGGLAVVGHSTRFLGPRIDMDRGSLLRLFSAHEILSFALSIAAVSYAIGIPAAFVALMVPVVWFAAFNRMMFGRTFAPKV